METLAEFTDRVSQLAVQVEDDALSETITVRKRASMYLGGASFCAFDPGDTDMFLSVVTGFDCWANASTVHETVDSGDVLGVLVTTYGPWTASEEGAMVVDLLEQTPEGQPLPAGLLLAGLEDAFAAPLLESWTRKLPDTAPLEVRSGLSVLSLPSPDVPEAAELAVNLTGQVRAYCLDMFGDIADGDEPHDDWSWLELPVLFVNADGAARLGLAWA